MLELDLPRYVNREIEHHFLSKVIGVPKIKSEQSSSLPHFDPLENQQIQRVSEPSPKPNLPKNETPNRFWSFVEPYCAPITPEDIKLLEDLIKVSVSTFNSTKRLFPI